MCDKVGEKEGYMGEKREIPKGYRHRSFVVPNEVLARLQEVADGQERSLNWVVVRILKEYCDGEKR